MTCGLADLALTRQQSFVVVTLLVLASVFYWEYYGNHGNGLVSSDIGKHDDGQEDMFRNVLHNDPTQLTSKDVETLEAQETQEYTQWIKSGSSLVPHVAIPETEAGARNKIMHSVPNFPLVVEKITKSGKKMDNDEKTHQTSQVEIAVSNSTVVQYKTPTNLTEHIPDVLRDGIQSRSYKAYWLDVDAPFLERLKVYNRAVGDLRKKIKEQRGFQNWQEPHPSPAVVWGSHDDFLEQLSNFTAVTTVALSWLNETNNNWDMARNVLVPHTYTWVASEPLCTWIRTPAFTKARWDAVYNRTCTTDIHDAARAIPLEPVYFYGKPINPDHYWPNKGLAYPTRFYTTPPPHLLYLHVTQDAIITSVGDVFSHDVKIVPYSCSHDINPSRPPGYETSAIFTEIFVMSGHWGSAHFHKSVELLPRIAPYLEFLRDNPSILIQVSETGGMTARLLGMLGVSQDRLVSGTVRAKLAYLPQGTPCGFSQVHGAQLLSWHYRQYIRTHLHTSKTESAREKTLVVIHRSGMRRISDSITVEMELKKLAPEFGLRFALYHDQQLPSLDDTMLMFNDAVLVVAPHGAGESNLMFCEPGTYVIEAVCNPPHVNMCYQHLAHILGHHYHAIPSNDSCEDHIEINARVLVFIAKAYLQQWSEQK